MIWDTEALETMAEASLRTGIPAKGTSGLLYRPFFNGAFGRHLAATDKDITVATEAQVLPYLTVLQQLRPHLRWSVASAAAKVGEADIEAAHGRHLLTFRRGSVWMEGGEICLHLPTETRKDLEAGLLRVDERRLGPDPEVQLRDLAERARRTMEEYQRLQVTGRLGDWLKRAAFPPIPARPQSENWFRRTPEALIAAFQRLDSQISLPPPPDLGPHPGPHSLSDALLLPDAAFREWFLQQVRSRTPIGGRDPALSTLLAVPMEGWPPLRRLRLLLLQTDALPEHRRTLRRALLAERNPACEQWPDEKRLSEVTLWEDCTAALLREAGESGTEELARAQAAMLSPEERTLLAPLWRARTAANAERRWLLPLEAALQAWA